MYNGLQTVAWFSRCSLTSHYEQKCKPDMTPTIDVKKRFFTFFNVFICQRFLFKKRSLKILSRSLRNTFETTAT